MGIAASLIAPPQITTPPPSVLAVATPDIVSTTRILPSAASATLSNLQVGDDAHSNLTVVMRTADSSAAANTTQSTSTATLTGSLNSSGPSSSFLAQLYGQGADPDNVTLAASFSHFAPAPLYNALVQYGYIKYRPSDAGIPQQSASGDIITESANTPADTVALQTPQTPAAQQNSDSPVTSPANDYQAYSITQSRNQSALLPEAQIAISG